MDTCKFLMEIVMVMISLWRTRDDKESRASMCAAVLKSVDQKVLPEPLLVLVKAASEGLPNVHK